MTKDFPLEFRVTIHPTSTAIPVKNPYALFTKYKIGDIIKKNESGATHDLEVINKEVLYRWGSNLERYLFDMGVKQLDQPCNVDEKPSKAPTVNNLHVSATLNYAIVDEADRALDFPIPDVQAIQRMLEKGDKIYTTTANSQIVSTIIKHEEVQTSRPGGALNILLKTFVDVKKTPKP